MSFHSIPTAAQKGFCLVTQTATVTCSSDGNEPRFSCKTQNQHQYFFGKGWHTWWWSCISATENGTKSMAPIKVRIALLTLLTDLRDLLALPGLKRGKFICRFRLGTPVAPPSVKSTWSAATTALWSEHLTTRKGCQGKKLTTRTTWLSDTFITSSYLVWCSTVLIHLTGFGKLRSGKHVNGKWSLTGTT